MLSSEIALRVGTPSSGSRTTSESTPRIVRVKGATVTQRSLGRASERVRIRTGRQPKGSGRLAHQIWPWALPTMRGPPIGEILDGPDLREAFLSGPDPGQWVVRRHVEVVLQDLL